MRISMTFYMDPGKKIVKFMWDTKDPEYVKQSQTG